MQAPIKDAYMTQINVSGRTEPAVAEKVNIIKQKVNNNPFNGRLKLCFLIFRNFIILNLVKLAVF